MSAASPSEPLLQTSNFFGARASGSLTVSLLSSELHVTSLALAALPASGRVAVRVSTARVRARVTVATLSAAMPHALVDLSFFPADESVEFTTAWASSEGAAAGLPPAVDIAGSAAVFGEGLPDDDEEEEEVDDGEKNKASAAGGKSARAAPAPAPAAAEPRLTGTEKLKRRRDEAAATAAAAAAAAIGSAKKEGPPPAKQARIGEPAPAPAASPAAAPPAPPLPARGPVFTELAGGKLKIMDTLVGRGETARRGHKVSVNYVGRLGSTKAIFDENKTPSGFTFRLGSNEVIPGWEMGIMGMTVGGKRTRECSAAEVEARGSPRRVFRTLCPHLPPFRSLSPPPLSLSFSRTPPAVIIHPKLAYGASGAPPQIPSNATLVFE